MPQPTTNPLSSFSPSNSASPSRPPFTTADTDPDEWLKIAYSVDTLTTQLDGHLTADQADEPVVGVPTSSSTDPATVVGMIEALDLATGHRVLE
ncbi:hypothetical protein ACWDNT_18980 [Streptomyces sp. NPDC000963]